MAIMTRLAETEAAVVATRIAPEVWSGTVCLDLAAERISSAHSVCY